MVLGGLALAFSRLIDNSVVVLENIFRHLEMGEARKRPRRLGGQGGRAACAGRHVHYGHRLLSRWSFSTASATSSSPRWLCPSSSSLFCFLSRRDDCRAALLRAFIKTCASTEARSGSPRIGQCRFPTICSLVQPAVTTVSLMHYDQRSRVRACCGPCASVLGVLGIFLF